MIMEELVTKKLYNPYSAKSAMWMPAMKRPLAALPQNPLSQASAVTTQNVIW